MKKATMTLSINFWNEKITDELKNEFMQAVTFEANSMNIQMLDEQIEKLEKKISNEKDTYSKEEVAAFKVQLQASEDLKKKLEDENASLNEIYNKVVSTMSQKNKDGFGNKKDVVRTVLRVLATWNNSKLTKYAIIPAFSSPALYEALETIHVTSKAGDDGNIIMSKEVKEAYKQASQELETIIKTTFSLPFETEYTAKTRVKMTAEDKKLLNEVYVSNFKDKWDADEEKGTISFKSRSYTTLVRATKDKKTNEMRYDYSKLGSTISKIVIRHYFK